jgi:hypothetical protein
MKTWRNWHIYYSDPNRLLRDCLRDLVADRGGLKKLFWVRHYAGGAHIRVRAHGSVGAVEQFSEYFVPAVESFLLKMPSLVDRDYSSTRAGALLSIEEGSLEGVDLGYRVNEIIPSPYDRENHGLPSASSLDLLEDFYERCGSLAIETLSSERGVLVEALRFYYLMLIHATGSVERGAVSAKSHWSGFAAFRLNPALVAAVQESYSEQRQLVQGVLREVIAFGENPGAPGDDLLNEWNTILGHYRSKARELLAGGQELCFHLTSLQAKRQREQIREETFQTYPFLGELWRDPSFLSAMRSDIHLALPRVLTNLYYAMIGPQLGLRAIDKIALCYFVFTSVEEHFHCNLTDTLSANVASARRRSEAVKEATGAV